MNENELKYGDKKDDVIAEAFNYNYASGIAFCFLNIRKYLKRFHSESEKCYNQNDIDKVKDYLQRAKENTNTSSRPFEYFELKIQEKRFKEVYDHSFSFMKILIESHDYTAKIIKNT